MSSNEREKELRRVTRVALRLPTETVLENWKLQLKESFPAFAPSYSDLVAWAVEHTPILSKKDCLDIKYRYFDEVSELESLLCQLKEAKASGNQDQMSDLLNKVVIRRSARRNTRSKKKKGIENESLNDNER